MSRSRTQRLLTRQVRADSAALVPDDLIVEEPLSIQIDGVLVSTTMRTPGNDFELAAGFLLAEGMLGSSTIGQIRYCGTGSAMATEFNVVSVETIGSAPPAQPRLGPTSSSCGVCGSDAIIELAQRLARLPAHEPWDRTLLMSLPDRLRGDLPLFDATGSVHSAVAFGRSGQVVVAREDIGRHNAVDKVVGRLLLDSALPASEMALFVSGRASFEMVQKAWAAGFTALVAASGPSVLAVQTARRAGMTLAGFARSGGANFYSPDGG
jgi:FdhD protein